MTFSAVYYLLKHIGYKVSNKFRSRKSSHSRCQLYNKNSAPNEQWFSSPQFQKIQGRTHPCWLCGGEHLASDCASFGTLEQRLASAVEDERCKKCAR
uniref:Uncharacterized protein n=1 Tax=Ditylenchus dipsaci TaxID=166011 RepID=A0A915DYA1_9BILA